MDVVKLAWARYLTQLERKPLKTKAITAAVISACSDILAQSLTAPRGSGYNWQRTLALALYGFFVAAPSSHYWLATLERLFPNKSDPLRSLKKVLLDQISFGPMANFTFLSFVTVVVEGKPLGQAMERIRDQYPSVQKRGWRLWPVAQFINQEFVPLKLRVLWCNAVAFCWSLYLILQARAPKVAVCVK